MNGEFDTVTDIPLVACLASIEEGYLDYTSGALLCPKDLGPPATKSVDTSEDEDKKDERILASKKGSKSSSKATSNTSEETGEDSNKEEDSSPGIGLLRGLPGKKDSAYMVFGIRFVEGVKVK